MRDNKTGMSGRGADGQAQFPEKTPDGHAARLADTARLRALEETGLLSAAGDPVLDRATRLATRITGVPVALLSVVDTSRQVFASQSGLGGANEGLRETPLSHSFCQYVVSLDRPLEVEDARRHPLLQDNGAIRDLSVIAYLGHPVHAPDGSVIGSFCAISDKPHRWSAEDHAAIADLAGMVESELRLRDAVARNDFLMRELDHRVRNLFTVAAGMVRLAQREVTRDDSVENRQEALAERLSARFAALSRAHALALRQEGEEEAEAVSLGDVVARVLAPYLAPEEAARADRGPDIALRHGSVTYLALALHELATNAVKYGGLSETGTGLDVTWAQSSDGGAALTWHERGVCPKETASQGFGGTLLHNAVVGGLSGRIERTIGDGSLIVEILLPASILSA